MPTNRFASVVLSLAALAGCAGWPQLGVQTEPARLRDPLPTGGYGPELVVIPAGQFTMGSPSDEDGRYPDEGPQHRVTFAKPFALGRTEITVGDFRRFIEATGYVTGADNWQGSYWRDPATGGWELVDASWRHDSRGEPADDDLPVVYVTREDALAYVTWLSQVTGRQYRLPSEAEFEYANRAGTTTVFWWGNGTPRQPIVNIRGDRDRVLADGSWNFTPAEQSYIQAEGEQPLVFENYGDGHWWPAPAGKFSPNPFGVIDMAGNVWEWTADCWHESYDGAPADGRAWIDSGECESSAVRGGSYYCAPRHVRSANRWRRWNVMRTMHIGFRVARDL